MMNLLDKIYRHYLDHRLVSTDSKQIKPGSIFFALRGEYFNGNQFAAEALERGASLAIVDEAPDSPSNKFVLVENVLNFLQKLAMRHRDNLRTKFISITGTNGKTTTKELIHRVLASTFGTLATKGNLNNHIGVPLTLLSLDFDTEFAVIEMGANHLGEIAFLCHMVRPEFGLITNIGKAHLEGFGGIEGVIRAKSELYDYLRKNNGTVFLNADNSLLVQLARDIEKKFTYGTAEKADCRGSLIKENPFLELEWNCRGVTENLPSHLYGNYNFENILAAVSIGEYFRVEKEKITNAISSYYPVNNRSQIITTDLHNTLIMDAYNANPTSMEMALRSFHSFPGSNKMVILGDMLELGNNSLEEHQKIIEHVKHLGFDHVFLAGEIFYSLTVPGHWMKFQTAFDLRDWLKENKVSNHTILIKGSRKIKLEILSDIL